MYTKNPNEMIVTIMSEFTNPSIRNPQMSQTGPVPYHPYRTRHKSGDGECSKDQSDGTQVERTEVAVLEGRERRDD